MDCYALTREWGFPSLKASTIRPGSMRSSTRSGGGAVSSADTRALQAPFRSGIEIEDYQLDPVVRAIQMPRVNLLVADDVGLGKTIEAVTRLDGTCPLPTPDVPGTSATAPPVGRHALRARPCGFRSRAWSARP